ncbi:MAG: pyrroline-5-carboxylate reductase [Armatimonadetes bacterium]|nr:pyrroline-5-carboxylate reductase [Armatimonadota bacterium]
MLSQRIAFIGAGAMGSAIARGLVARGVCPPENLLLSDVRREWVEGIAGEIGARVAHDNVDAVKQADVILLAVKPQVFTDVAQILRPYVTPDHLVISIMGGIEIGTLEATLGEGIPVVRVMPNILAQVGAAYSVYSPGEHVTPEHEATVKALLGAVGEVEAAEEKLMDAVTGLSGSGPAFVFVMIEALADGGVKAGLSRPLALKLAAHTLFGAAKMWMETGKHPGELKDMVTSPAGTTIAGLAEMEAAGVRSGLIRTVDAAAKRSRELSGK